MRYNLALGAIVAATLSGAVADNALEERGAFEELGNWYKNSVKKISYTGVGKAGSYQKVTQMYPSCQTETYHYSGPLSPFDEEVSCHFRGPMELKQVAIYSPSTTSKTKARRTAHERRHGHAGFHKRNKEIREIQERAEAEKRQVGATVTATINGEVVHWLNTWSGQTDAPAAPEPAATPETSAAPVESVGYIGNAASSYSDDDDDEEEEEEKTSASEPTTTKTAAAGDWERIAYYNQEDATADGLVFLNNKGGSSSGVFDNKYGNSLSYASADCQEAASSPQVSNGTLGSNQEIAIYSDKKCSKDGGKGCGFYRKGSVAYHGFDGAQKAFFFEFSMPLDGTKGFNADMSSLWLLNAAISRTAQYNGCSCWRKCGEFDVAEVLNSGNTKMKSTWHGNNAGGSSDYFDRPIDGPIKMAVVMANNNINVQVIDDDFDFDEVLSKGTINSLASTKTNNAKNFLSSLFSLSGSAGAGK